MIPKHIPFIKPKFPEPEELTEDLRLIYENNYYSNNGPIYFEFKKNIEAYIGQDIKAVIVSNATQALMISIQAIFGSRKQMGKKYIAIPSFTFAAGPLAIKWCGFEPIFFDIEPESTQPNLKSFNTLYQTYHKDLAGIVLINSFGIGNSDIKDWSDLLREKDIPIIIDSAPGFGSTYQDGNLIGGAGECEIFSFHVTKPFGIGEGGLITTKNAELAETLESLKNFGFDEHKRTVRFGMNAKITEIDCAIGLRILEKYPDTLADRRKTYRKFEEKLREGKVDFLPRADSAAIQFVTILVDPKKRGKLLQDLKNGGVETRTYYAPATHTFPFFAETPKTKLPNTEAVSEKVVSLPLHPNMEASIVDYICDIIIKSLQES